MFLFLEFSHFLEQPKYIFRLLQIWNQAQRENLCDDIFSRGIKHRLDFDSNEWNMPTT